jgi:lipopolysaccharide export system protein LptA
VLLGDDGGAPISVDARSMELQSKERLVIFTGEVTAVKGEMTINADRIEVRSTEEQQIKQVTASGNVRLRKGEIAAVAGAADYNLETDVAVLSGEPKVWRGRDAVSGEKISINFTDGRISVEKASAVLFPQETKPGGVKK